MKIEKDIRRVSIVCQDGSLVNGYVHILQGERIRDFINDPKESFIPITKANFYNKSQVQLFKLFGKKGKETVLLNKSAILLIKEI
jgi:hypothetical protein